MRTPNTFLSLLASISLAGCSVLVGNVRPMEEPAPLEKLGKPDAAAPTPLLPLPWKKMEVPAKSAGSPESGAIVPELSFQNEETGSTLAYTSGCRKSYQKAPPSLRTISQSLGSGLSRIRRQEPSEILVSGVPALKSSMTGWAGGSEIAIENVVLAREGCVFDLTLVSLARHRDRDRAAFDKVLATLPLSR
jgi:hypothetical protein